MKSHLLPMGNQGCICGLCTYFLILAGNKPPSSWDMGGRQRGVQIPCTSLLSCKAKLLHSPSILRGRYRHILIWKSYLFISFLYHGSQSGLQYKSVPFILNEGGKMWKHGESVGHLHLFVTATFHNIRRNLHCALLFWLKSTTALDKVQIVGFFSSPWSYL